MKMQRLIASILLASMTLTMAACSDSSTTTTTDTASSTTSTSTEVVTDTNPYGLKYDGMYCLSDEPVTLTAFIHAKGTQVLTNDMEIPQEIAQFTNISLDGVAPEYNNDSQQAFNLLMTEATLPDLIGGNIVDINKYALEGVFLPLNDLIDEYAPNIKAAFELYPEAQAAVTVEDGNIYCIPFVYEEVVSKAWFIRQDWLDTLGLEVPTTFDEFETVMYAFRDDDPNGNGIADEIPMFVRKGDDNALEPYLQLFGVSTEWHTTEDGIVQIGMYTEEYKDAMIGVANWYAEGLIYQEVFNADYKTRDLLYPADNGGVLCDWIASTSAYNESVPEYVEGFQLSAMLPPADVNGDVWIAYSRARTSEYGWGMSCDNIDPVASIKYMDFLFSDKGRDITTYGIEGYHFNYNEDGDPIYTDMMFTDDQTLIGKINAAGGSLSQMAYLHDATYEYQVMDVEGERATEMYSDVANVLNAPIPSLSFTTDESDLISSIYPSCEAYMLEKTQTWTFDPSRIESEFDEYMSTLQTMGMDKVVAAYQAAYDRMVASVS